jgi:hypothetical protein
VLSVLSAASEVTEVTLIRPPWPVAATRDENRVCPAKLGSRAAETVGTRAIFVSEAGFIRSWSG